MFGHVQGPEHEPSACKSQMREGSSCSAIVKCSVVWTVGSVSECDAVGIGSTLGAFTGYVALLSLSLCCSRALTRCDAVL